MKIEKRVLFILKKREDYGSKLYPYVQGLSTGLLNSAGFMNDMLTPLKITSDMVVVNDDNDIDREVTKYKPTHVIIESLWVVPKKFDELSKLHPNVIWIIRIHSNSPFLAGEGIAIKWISSYLDEPNVIIAANSSRMQDEIITAINKAHTNVKDRVILLPNFYPQEYEKVKSIDYSKEYIDISCFGAIRPLKNHLTQAIAAIRFADDINKKLRFHINSGRIEMSNDSVFKNLVSLFECNSRHELIDHAWVQRDEFIKTCRKMDIGMQVSFSETFNIVAADHISQGVPIVVSEEVPWATSIYTTEPTNSEYICLSIKKAYYFNYFNVLFNQWGLRAYTNKTKKIWCKHFGG